MTLSTQSEQKLEIIGRKYGVQIGHIKQFVKEVTNHIEPEIRAAVKAEVKEAIRNHPFVLTTSGAIKILNEL